MIYSDFRKKDSFIVLGGKPLSGSVPVSGYKHALTLIIGASIAVNNVFEILNVPNISETHVIIAILQKMGARCQFYNGALQIDTRNIQTYVIPDLSKQIHGSVYLLPSLLYRFGRVDFSGAGGDKIGGNSSDVSRELKHILSVLERFGAEIEVEGDRVIATCRKFSAQELNIMDYSSNPAINSGPYVSGATKTAILCAAFSEGTSVIHNPVNKETSLELLSFLTKCGCQLETSNSYFKIDGHIQSTPISVSLISDITEIVTYIACAVYLRCSLTIKNVTIVKVERALSPELSYLNAMGVKLYWGNDWIKIEPPESVNPVDIEANHWTLNTDCHPIFALMLTTSHGVSHITDHVWINRFGYTQNLNALGASLEVKGNTVSIFPRRPNILGMCLDAMDTRAGAVTTLAALGIDGYTVIQNTHHIHRGYENFAQKLRNLGAHIDD